MQIRPHRGADTPGSGEATPVVHEDPELRFSVRVPGGWQARRTLRARNYWRVAFAAPGGEARAVVDVMVDKQPEDAAASWERLSRRLAKAAGSRYRKIGIREAPLGGEAGARWEFVLESKRGKALRKIDIGAFHVDSGYAILCEAPEATFDTYRPQFEAIIQSFQFTGAD